MLDKKFWLGILVMTLVFGMTVVDSAFGQDTALNGKWRLKESRYGGYVDDSKVNYIVQYTFLAGNYETRRDPGSGEVPFEKGTYTTNSKGEIILKPTHCFDEMGKKWYSKNDFIKNMKSNGYTDAEIKEEFEDEEMFIDRSFVYSIGSTTLELYQGREKITYYKR